MGTYHVLATCMLLYVSLTCNLMQNYYTQKKKQKKKQPGQLLSVWLYIHELSFTLKSRAELLVFISAVYAWPLPGATSTTVARSKFVLPVGSLPLMICSGKE